MVSGFLGLQKGINSQVEVILREKEDTQHRLQGAGTCS